MTVTITRVRPVDLPSEIWTFDAPAPDVSLPGAWAGGWHLVDAADPQPVTDRRYYVTAVDAGRTAFLAGPYPTHTAALAQVDAVRRRTEDSYPFAVFWAFGTASLEGSPEKTWRGEFSG